MMGYKQNNSARVQNRNAHSSQAFSGICGTSALDLYDYDDYSAQIHPLDAQSRWQAVQVESYDYHGVRAYLTQIKNGGLRGSAFGPAPKLQHALAGAIYTCIALAALYIAI